MPISKVKINSKQWEYLSRKLLNPIIKASTIAFKGNNGIKRIYNFSKTGSYFGITQYLNIVPKTLMKKLEIFVQKVEATATGQETLAKGQSDLWEKSLDISQKNASSRVRRIKWFGGGRYSYGNVRRGIDFQTDVLPIEDFPVLLEFISRMKAEGIIDTKFQLNQVGCNIYYTNGLGVHRDKVQLFKRQIISLRLFRPTVLNFGCYGQISAKVSPDLSVPLEVGTITIMEGVAADYYQHSIRQIDVPGRTAVIIFRNLQDIFK